LNLPKDIFSYVYNPPTSAEELTFHELLALRTGVRGTAGMSLNNSMMLDAPHLAFYLHRKLAAPLAALVAVLLAIPLSLHFGRSGGYVGLLLSVVLAFFFIVTQQWTQILAETYRLHPVFAAWAPDALYGILGLVLLVREE
ncbi:MAG TPA: LptF/LptG family permease, partial [Armatimonadota bacterium]|jgi:lipopolysaccharide export LptBFGC system permease protein LptF